MKKNKHTPAPLLCWDIYSNMVNSNTPIPIIPIGGLQKQSLVDFSGNVSAVLFTCGCNFRCSYCHNPDLVYPDLIDKTKKIDYHKLFSWLKKNKKLLDAVVITGGEPTVHASLPELINDIRKLNLKIKLDTNGTNPDMLEMLIHDKAIDYVAMDIKAPLVLDKYKNVVGNCFNQYHLDKVQQSAEILMKKLVSYEFRTTLDKTITQEDLEVIIQLLSGNYYIQQLQKEGVPSQPAPEFLDVAELNKIKSDVHVFVR
jgi:pyruvate formate lyase activating enzyme